MEASVISVGTGSKEGVIVAPPGVVPLPVVPGSVSRPPMVPATEAEKSTRSRSSALVGGAALTRLLKLCIGAVVLLASAYLFTKQALPVLIELAKPGAVKVEAKDAAVGVQMIRQTRDVVAKHDAHVDQVNAIVDGLAGPDPVKPAAPAEPVPAAPPPPKEPEVKINLKAANRFLSELPVNGVMGGASPRIVVNGLLINVNDVVDWRLGLVFAGVDETTRMLLFRHKDGTIVQRRY